MLQALRDNLLQFVLVVVYRTVGYRQQEEIKDWCGVVLSD